MKIKIMTGRFREGLKSIYQPGELDHILYLVFEKQLGYTKTDLVLNQEEELPDNVTNELEIIFEELKTGKPVQYVLKSAWFHGLEWLVDENVLIPRPETEELVDWIISDIQAASLRNVHHGIILDIGTGSGCIAISLKKKYPTWDIFALDVNEKSIRVAKTNARTHQTDINFVTDDILNWKKIQWPVHPTFDGKFNVIVSNPPYVTEGQRSTLENRVKDFEPSLALFVPDQDPLLFYRQISDFAADSLQERGKLYFEINQDYGERVLALLEANGFIEIELRKDFHGKERMVKAIKQG